MTNLCVNIHRMVKYLYKLLPIIKMQVVESLFISLRLYNNCFSLQIVKLGRIILKAILPQVTLITNMNRKPPNSTNMNYSARISNSEYASFNLFIKLFYNDLIFGHFFIVSQMQSPVTCSSTIFWDYAVMSFMSIVVEWNNDVKFLSIFVILWSINIASLRNVAENGIEYFTW